jgi:hypothetical protein
MWYDCKRGTVWKEEPAGGRETVEGDEKGGWILQSYTYMYENKHNKNHQKLVLCL